MSKAEVILMSAAVLLGILALGNGVYMLVAPESWYWAVPGVPDRGPFNQHFIRDIGIMYSLIGLSFIGGAFYSQYRVVPWSFASAWLLGHAAFHVWEVIVGLCSPATLVQDFAGVFLVAFIAAGLALFASRISTEPA